MNKNVINAINEAIHELSEQILSKEVEIFDLHTQILKLQEAKEVLQPSTEVICQEETPPQHEEEPVETKKRPPMSEEAKEKIRLANIGNDREKYCADTCTSKYKGVTYNKRNGTWYSAGWDRDAYKKVYLGDFKDEIEAAEAYDRYALKTRGPNAVTNFAKERYTV